MKAYFAGRERQALLLAEAQEWYGTPFVPHARVKGSGVDCVQLAAGLYISTGLLPDFKPGRYEMDGGQHNSYSQVISWLEGNASFQRAEMPLQVGDLLCFRMGRQVHHVGVVLTERTFVHVCQGYTVREAWIDDSTWRKRLTAIFRPMDTAEHKSECPSAVTPPVVQPLLVPLLADGFQPAERMGV